MASSGFWNQVPLVRIFLPFALGIGFSMFASFRYDVFFYLTIVLFLSLVIFYFYIRAYHWQWAHGVLLSLFLCCFAITLHISQDELSDPFHFSRLTNGGRYVIVKVNSPPQSKTNSLKLSGTVIGLANDKKTIYSASGNVIIYLKVSDSMNTIGYGHVLVIERSRFAEIKPPQNPDEFDYKRYLAFNHIHYSAYLSKQQLVVLDTMITNPVIKWVYQAQAYFKETLNQYIASRNEAAVAQALIYGHDDDIDKETVQAYSNTGTLHVLAVSGMHVGIIFMILEWMLRFMDRKKSTRQIKFVLVIGALWVYSLLCGMSPSILRATVMFTFIILGKMIGRRSNMYNSLAASALCLLIIDCNMLANVGFQLSYAAVLGIVFIQPLINHWWTPEHFILKQIWSITSVSIAAQISTCPIGILYFHQFPNCFLFSNLIIIPLTTLILYGGIILVTFSKITFLSVGIGKLLWGLIVLTNKIVQYVETIPYAYIDGIHISISQSALLYFIFLFIIFYFLHQRLYIFRTVLLLSIVYAFLESIHQIQTEQQQKLIVYNISRHHAVAFYTGNKATFIIDSSLHANHDKFKFHLQQNIWENSIREVNYIYYDSLWRIIRQKNMHIIMSGKGLPSTHNQLYDLAILSNNIHTDAFSKLEAKYWIVTSSVSKKQENLIRSNAILQKIPVYFVGDSGAFQLSLQ